MGVETCCSSGPAAAVGATELTRSSSVLTKFQRQFVFSYFVKIELSPHKVPKSQEHPAHVKFAAAAALGEQSGGCVCVHVASVGTHVAEGRSLAEYRLEEVGVLINACGQGRGGWRGFHHKNIT